MVLCVAYYIIHNFHTMLKVIPGGTVASYIIPCGVNGCVTGRV